MTWLPPRSLALAVLAAGLGGFGCFGGQSGTDADDTPCQTANAIQSYPTTGIILANVNGLRSLDGTWANQRQATRLDVDLTRGARIVGTNDNDCFSPLKYELTGRLTSSDGLVDVSTEFAPLYFEQGTAELAVGIGMLPSEYREPPWTFPSPVRTNANTTTPTLVLEYQTSPGHFVVNAALLVGPDQAVAVWSSDPDVVPPRQP